MNTVALFQAAATSSQLASWVALAVGLFAIASNSINMFGVVRKDGEERGALRTTLTQLTTEITHLRAGRDEDRTAREHTTALISDLAIQVSRIAAVTDSLVGRMDRLEKAH